MTRAQGRAGRRRLAVRRNGPSQGGGSVHLRIETLVLLGFPAGAADRIGRAARQELTRLIAERGVPAYMRSASDAPSIDAGSFRAAPGTHPADLGTQIAGAIHRGPVR
ncbi:MAG: hypothetical protein ACREAA_02070 [Candidatus Polarisedimenticolia bacterium]